MCRRSKASTRQPAKRRTPNRIFVSHNFVRRFRPSFSTPWHVALTPVPSVQLMAALLGMHSTHAQIRKRQGGDDNGCEGCDLGFWPHRQKRSARRRRGQAQRFTVRRHQRSGADQGQRAPVQIRQRARYLPGRGQGLRRFHRCRARCADQSAGREGPVEAAVEGPRRRHRHGMHGNLHRQGQGAGASDGGRQARARLSAVEGRRHHRRLRRQPREADGRPQGRVERLVHD